MSAEQSSVPDDMQTITMANPVTTLRPGAAVLGADPDSSVPLVFGRQIAKGGMGAILEGDDCKLGRKIAVKVMLDPHADSDQARRFVQEAAVLGRLEHPNIVPIHDLGRDADGALYYTMKLVKGRTLQHILDELRHEKKEALEHYTLDRLLTIFRKVCDALAFAHAQKIIHRDLKPENIMVGEFGEVLVMDWGISKILDGSADAPVRSLLDPISREAPPPSPTASLTATMDGAVMGTPNYMSPEQAMGKVNELDALSDIFSLGGILYAILTLRPPIEGKDVWEVLKKVQTAEVTPPTAFGANTANGKRKANGTVLDAQKFKPLPHCPGGRVPAALSAVAMQALTLDKADRYQDVASFSLDIERYQSGFATSAEKAGTWRQFTLFAKRHKAASIGVTAVLLIGSTLGAKAVIEGRRAAIALEDLRQNAPDMLALAESEAIAQHFDSELQKTDAALRLDPDLLAAYWRRAWGLVALGRFSDAATAVRTATKCDPAGARQFGSILPQIEKIAAVPTEPGRYAPDLLTPVFEFLQTHGASGEAGALIQHLRLTNDRRFAIAQERLKALGGSLAGLIQLPSGLIELRLHSTNLSSLDEARGVPFDMVYADRSNIESLESLRGLHLSKLVLSTNRISDLAALRGMTLVELNLTSNKEVSDLAPLAGMPLQRLELIGTNVVDLSPLRGMPLEFLSISATPVNDLGPLQGLPLRQLRAGTITLRDLSPLTGMPLETLELQSAHLLADLSPLAGLPLKDLDILHCEHLQDLTPLLRIPTLERLATDAPPALLSPLRQHPRLALINYQAKGYRPAAEVWAELDARQAAGKK